MDFDKKPSGGVANSGAVVDEFESLDIDDPLGSNSYASYRTAMSNLIDSREHSFSSSIVSTRAETDPLLSPLPEIDHVDDCTSNSSNSLKSDHSDVVINPLEDNGHQDAEEDAQGLSTDPQNSSTSSISQRPTKKAVDYLIIKVSNAQKEYEASTSIVPGGNTYVSYSITTKTNMQSFGGSEFCVRRRFRDVVTLADRLAESYRGFFIPPRPDKSVVESQVMQKQDFVEHRRIALEKYLKRLATHPVIRKSNELKVFLQIPGKLPLHAGTDAASRVITGAIMLPKQLLGGSRSVVLPHEVKHSAIGGRNLLRLFKEMKQSVANEWGNSRHTVMEEDKEYLDMKEKICGFESSLVNASKQADILVKIQQDAGNTMGELGLAFIKLTKFENENAMLDTQRTCASDLKNVATASIRASRIYRALNSKSVRNLDILHEYLETMLAARIAFLDRSSALLTVQTLVSEHSALQSKVAASSSKGFGSRNQKVEELSTAMRVTEDAKICAIKEYERIKENTRSELDRLNREKRINLLNMLKGFVNAQYILLRNK
ncbi:hypothetical protein V2J09_019017 [Rumex salicifolius]